VQVARELLRGSPVWRAPLPPRAGGASCATLTPAQVARRYLAARGS